MKRNVDMAIVVERDGELVPAKAGRKNPTIRQKCAALAAAFVGLPHEQAKTMTSDEIIGLVDYDHYPVAFSIARDIGWTPDEYNHPSNIVPRKPADHAVKTNTIDKPEIAKSKRVTDEHEAFHRRILAKTGHDSACDVEKSPRKPRSQLRSRGFQNAPEGHKWFKGRR